MGELWQQIHLHQRARDGLETRRSLSNPPPKLPPLDFRCHGATHCDILPQSHAMSSSARLYEHVTSGQEQTNPYPIVAKVSTWRWLQSQSSSHIMMPAKTNHTVLIT